MKKLEPVQLLLVAARAVVVEAPRSAAVVAVKQLRLSKREFILRDHNWWLLLRQHRTKEVLLGELLLAQECGGVLVVAEVVDEVAASSDPA
jgi:hypothetical protein